MAVLIVLDASVLIGYLDGSDAHHAAAEALLIDAVEDDLLVNLLTLAEVLVLPTREGRVRRVVDVLRDLEVQELPFPGNTAARLAKIRVDTGLRMPDCCVLLSADAARAHVASFDERLISGAQQLGLPVLTG